MARIFVDVALAFDAQTRRCDHVFDGRTFVLDATPATNMFVAIGTDRRARPDDEVLEEVGDPSAPNTLLARRGYPGDGLDTRGRRTGSRLYLLKNRKQTETTRHLAESAAAEALAFFETERGMAGQVAARWVRPQVLGLVMQVAATQIKLDQVLTP